MSEEIGARYNLESFEKSSNNTGLVTLVRKDPDEILSEEIKAEYVIPLARLERGEDKLILYSVPTFYESTDIPMFYNFSIGRNKRKIFVVATSFDYNLIIVGNSYEPTRKGSFMYRKLDEAFGHQTFEGIPII